MDEIKLTIKTKDEKVLNAIMMLCIQNKATIEEMAYTPLSFKRKDSKTRIPFIFWDEYFYNVLCKYEGKKSDI